MKASFIFLSLLSWVLVSCTFSEDQFESPYSFEELLCDYRQNPIGIDNPNPRLTWKVTSEMPERKQSAYQVLVASSEGNLKGNRGDIWDSGKVLSDQSAQVEYKGQKFLSRKTYYWKVRIWDDNDVASPFSEMATWEMGLLTPTPWKSKWISAPRLFDWAKRDRDRKRIPKDAPPEMEEPAPIFRKEFSTDGEILKARAYISGLGYYELYMNGEKVGDHVLDPAFTAYNKRVLYQTYDVTAYLNDKDNCIGIMLGNGWYNMSSRGVWSFDRSPWRDDPTVRMQLRIQYESGNIQTIYTDDTWNCAPGPIVFNSIRQGECYDARNEEQGWNTPGFDASGWQPVRVVRGPEGKMAAQSMPPIRIVEKIGPKTITKIGSGNYLVDFGQNMAGFIEMSIESDAGHEIQFKYGEKLLPDGGVDQGNIEGLVASAPFQTDIYITKGGTSESWHPRFVYHGFQYVEISGWPGELSPDQIRGCFVTTDMNKRGEFSSSSALLNTIQQNTQYSFQSNYHGYPTDCPHREKNGWTGDAQLASEMALFNYEVETSYDKWIGDMTDSQLKSGMVSAIVPTGGWGYYWGNGPAWDVALINIPWNTYVFSGDRQVLEKYFPFMEAYFNFLSKTAENQIINWGLGDWVPVQTETPANLITTAYYGHMADLMSDISAVLGDLVKSKDYAEKAARIKDAFRSKFYGRVNGTYGNGSQTSLACPVYLNILEPAEKRRVVDKLARSLKESELNLDFGVLGAKFVPNALADNGYKDLAFSRINNTNFPGWGHWAARGATSLWEDWKGDGSLNHIFFGDVSAWFFKYLGGIRPDPAHPGFSHFYIDPYFPEDLSWVRSEVNTVRGKVISHWEKTGNSVIMKIEIPFNSEATILIPDHDNLNVILKTDDRNEIVTGTDWTENSLGLKAGIYEISFKKK